MGTLIGMVLYGLVFYFVYYIIKSLMDMFF